MTPGPGLAICKGQEVIETMSGVATVGSKRILVVDDEGPLATLIAEVLSSDGHRVDTAPNGLAALARVEHNDYDLILSDLRMPELDGPGLYRELERRRPELLSRIAFVTGSAHPSSKSRSAWSSSPSSRPSCSTAPETRPPKATRLAGLGSELHDHLAEVVAREKPEEGLPRAVDPPHHGHLVPDPPCLHRTPDVREESRIAIEVIGDDEALHPHAIAHQVHHVPRTGLGGFQVVLRDHPAEGNAGEGVHEAENRVQHGTAHVLEVDVHALRAGS